MSDLTYESALATLRRVPDRIILATMGRKLVLTEGDYCLCGWFVREQLAEMQNVGASTVKLCEGDLWRHDLPELESAELAWSGATRRSSAIASAKLFGGTEAEWESIYMGVSEKREWRYPLIEAAFVTRVDEACGFGPPGDEP